MTIAKHFVLAAGGTGGHMVPAHALASELMQRGHRVMLITDERGARIPGLFQDVEVHVLPAGRLGHNPLSWLRAAAAIRRGRAKALALFREFEPSAVIGFGGYPALPALLAALSRGIPSVVHEQNAILGRVNRLLAGRVSAIATSYARVARLKENWSDKTYLVGNPVRAEIIALREDDFPPLDENGIFRILVTGGSQGASILSHVVPSGLGLLPLNFRRRLQVTQQCRPEDIQQVSARYAELGIPADLSSYIADLPARLSWAHLVIGRAGASTIAELTVAGRPAILIPLPSATDDHQTANVMEMIEAGGARAIGEDNFTPVELAKQMQKLGLDPAALANAARRARGCGRPDATLDLANLLESLGPAAIPPAAIQFKPAFA